MHPSLTAFICLSLSVCLSVNLSLSLSDHSHLSLFVRVCISLCFSASVCPSKPTGLSLRNVSFSFYARPSQSVSTPQSVCICLTTSTPLPSIKVCPSTAVSYHNCLSRSLHPHLCHSVCLCMSLSISSCPSPLACQTSPHLCPSIPGSLLLSNLSTSTSPPPSVSIYLHPGHRPMPVPINSSRSFCPCPSLLVSLRFSSV